MSIESISVLARERPTSIAVEELNSRIEGLEAELEHAGAIVLTRGERAFAEIRPLQFKRSQKRAPFHERMPDFDAQLKEMWGDRVFPDSTALIRADRDGE